MGHASTTAAAQPTDVYATALATRSTACSNCFYYCIRDVATVHSAMAESATSQSVVVNGPTVYDDATA